MRKLKTGDLMMVASLLGKIGKGIKIEEGATAQEVGIQIFAHAMQYAEQDFSRFLASVAEMSVEEFNNQPFDFPLTVIEHLASNEDLSLFFGRAKGLLGKLNLGS